MLDRRKLLGAVGVAPVALAGASERAPRLRCSKGGEHEWTIEALDSESADGLETVEEQMGAGYTLSIRCEKCNVWTDTSSGVSAMIFAEAMEQRHARP